jgi:peptidoglycan/xylan/chitin deacetylase (PgdA/CDA1 family)
MRVPGFKTLRQSARWLQSRFRNSGLILGYHRVAHTTHDPHMMCVAPNNFSGQLAALRQYAHPIRLQELVQGIQRGTLHPRAVSVTFDDGYADVLHQALPLLERYEIPATVFIVTGALGQVFQWDNAIHSQATLDSQEEQLRRALTAEELRELAASDLIEIAAHTVTHPMLAIEPVATQRNEIQQSKAFLEAFLGRQVSGFSYPHGSVTTETRDIVCESGYEYACTSFNDVVWRGSDLLRLPRFWVPNCHESQFGRWLRWWLHR